MSDSTNPDSNACRGSSKSLASLAIKLLVALGILAILIGLLMPAINIRGPAPPRAMCLTMMKQIALALDNYAASHGGVFPPAYTTDANGKLLHSWRTLILPYMNKIELYKSIDLSKPWNDPVNAEALKSQVDVYRCPSTSCAENHTTYLAVVTPNSCLLPTEPRRRSEILADHSQVLMVVEVDESHAVPWMQPVDADESVVLGIGQAPLNKVAHSGGVFNAVFVDGHGKALKDNISADQLRAMISVRPEDKAGLKMPE